MCIVNLIQNSSQSLSISLFFILENLKLYLWCGLISLFFILDNLTLASFMVWTANSFTDRSSLYLTGLCTYIIFS